MHKLIIEKNELLECPLDWQRQGFSETQTGYGKSLTSKYKVNYLGKLRRVYATCYSNVSFYYIKVKDKNIFLDIF